MLSRLSGSNSFPIFMSYPEDEIKEPSDVCMGMGARVVSIITPSIPSSIFEDACSTVFANPFDEKMLGGIGYRSDLKDIAEKIDEKFTSYRAYFDREFFNQEGVYFFELKKGALPGEGLGALLRGPTVADCLLASSLVLHKVIYDAIGEDKFNAIFKDRSYRFGQCVDWGNGPEIPTLSRLDLVRHAPESELQIGDCCYFSGVPSYVQKHPGKDWGGWSVIYCGTHNGERMFHGLGLSSPQPEREILRILIEAYNEPSETTGIEHQVAFDPEKVKRLYPTFGFDSNMIFRLNASLLEEIQKTPADQLLPQGSTIIPTLPN